MGRRNLLGRNRQNAVVHEVLSGRRRLPHAAAAAELLDGEMLRDAGPQAVRLPFQEALRRLRVARDEEAIAGMMKNGPAKSYSAWLGLKLQELTGGLKKKFAVENGALVSFVEAGSPAAQAGFAAGDIVAEADGIKITGTDQFSSLMNIKLPGQTMRFAVIRNGSALIATLKLGQVSGKEKVLSGANYLGMYVSDLTPGMVAKYDISEHAGAVIIAIDRNSKAMSGGLNEGDLIVEIDKQPVRNTEDFNKITSKASLDNGVLIVITRSGKSMYTVLYR